MLIISTKKPFVFLLIVLILALIIGVKGCRNDRSPTNPSHLQKHSLSLRLNDDSALQAKATALTVRMEGLNAQGEPTGTDLIEERLASPEFPLELAVGPRPARRHPHHLGPGRLAGVQALHHHGPHTSPG